MDRSDAIAIIGIGCLFPKAKDRSAFWANIVGGVDAIREVPESHWKAAEYLNPDPKTPDHVYTARGGFLDPIEFDPLEHGISPNNLEATDSSQLLSLVATQQALDDAGYGAGGKAFDRKRTSVLLGVTGTLQLVIPLGARLGHPLWRKALAEAGVDHETAEDVVQRIAAGYVPWQENSFPGLLGNVVAGRIANRFDFGGSNCVVDAACASSLGAVHLAAMELQSGRADMVVTGGVDCFNDIFMYMCFSKTPALSPTGNSRPFDADGDGTILGEGMGILLMKRLNDAEQAGDRVYAVLKGIGTSSDGRGNAIYAPTAKGQVACLRSAHQSAGVDPSTIELVEAHGTGTKVGDAVEVSALAEVFGESKRTGSWCSVGSIKSQIGHTKAAAGAAGLIKAAMALHHKVLPPTIKVSRPLDGLSPRSSPLHLNASARPWMPAKNHPRRAGVSSFGFGGSNFHAILEEHGSKKSEIDWDIGTQIVAFSAPTQTALKNAVASWTPSADPNLFRIQASETRKAFRLSHHWRAIAVVDRERSAEEIKTTLLQTIDAAEVDGKAESPLGVFVGSGSPTGKLGVLFPGQGSQYVGMMREWAIRFPAMFEVLTEADAVCSEHESFQNRRLSEAIYPPSAFDEVEKTRQQQALQATDVAQPALGAVSLGALSVLGCFGVKPAIVGGHSYGELVALCAAQCYDRRSLHRLSLLRGRLMANEAGDDGAMLAVSAPIAEVERFVAEHRGLTIANRNAPRQVVLSGKRDAILIAGNALNERGIRSKQLAVSAAFHSDLVAKASTAFAEAVNEIAYSSPETPVFANTTGSEYPTDIGSARALLSNQLARPVEFVAQINNMHEAGVRTFLEVGPGNKLAGLIRANLEGKPNEVISVDPSNGERPGLVDLARVLAKLASLGHHVDLSVWDPVESKPVAPKRMSVKLTGANYVAQRPEKPKRISRPEIPAKEHHIKAESTPAVEARPREAAPAPKIIETNMPPVNDAVLQGIAAIQNAQERAAQLHKQFLDQQLAAQQALLAMLGSTSAPLPLVQQPARPQTTELRSPIEYQAATNPAPQVVIPTSIIPPLAKQPVAPPPVVAVADDTIANTLLAVVADKTGYPAEMLNLEMGLDADLGIDSIKRVEILSAVQEKLPQAATIAADQLGSLRTLGDVVKALGALTPSAEIRSGTPIAPSSVVSDSIAETLLAVVADKTGYPAEMLNLEMGLDADLGIDSIKRVEILSAVQEKLPQAATIAADQLGSLRTLGDVAKALGSITTAAPSTAVDSLVSKGTGTSTKVSAPAHDIAATLIAIVADKTGYPADMLNLEMGLDADLGIDSIKRVEILSAVQEKLPNVSTIAAEELGSLRTLGDIAAALAKGGMPASANGQVTVSQAAPAIATAFAKVQSLDIYLPTWLHAEAPSSPLSPPSGVILIVGSGPRAESLAAALSKRNIKTELRKVEEALGPSSTPRVGGLVFIADRTDAFGDGYSELKLMQKYAADLQAGGLLGSVIFDDAGVNSATLAGLIKTARWEWTNTRCKVITAVGDSDIEKIADELFAAGPCETRLDSHGRSEIRLAAWRVAGKKSTPPIQPNDVVLVTGGARGVTAAAANALARAFSPTLVLLGRTLAPTPEPAWLANASDEIAVRRLLMEHAADRPSPKQLAERTQATIANREVLRSLEQLKSTGARVEYRQVDVCDSTAVANTIDEIRQTIGPIRGFVHGAGVLADRLIVEKTEEDYRRVFDVKIRGAENVLASLEGDLRFLVLFSSSTARFGRKGQSDYAAANEVLNAIARRESKRRPGCRVVSFNWGPWDGGMVTPALKGLFAAEGIEVIPIDAGANLLVDVLMDSNPDVTELVVLGAGSKLPTEVKAELRTPEPKRDSDALSLAMERRIDEATHPVLRSHRLKGKAVLPAALMIEWFAHAALVRNPGLQVVGIDDFTVLNGLKLAAGESRSVRFLVGKSERGDGKFRIPAELRSFANDREILHARATVILGSRLEVASGPASATPPNMVGEPCSVERAYTEFLFHGDQLRGITEIPSVGDSGASALLACAPRPSMWFTEPHRTAWCTDPLVLDSVFQLMIVWSRMTQGMGSLPVAMGSLRLFSPMPTAGSIRAEIRITDRRQHSARADVELFDSTDRLIARINSYECVLDASLNSAFALEELGAGS